MVQAIDRLLSLPAGDASVLPGEVDDSKMNEEQGKGTENKQNVIILCVFNRNKLLIEMIKIY